MSVVCKLETGNVIIIDIGNLSSQNQWLWTHSKWMCALHLRGKKIFYFPFETEKSYDDDRSSSSSSDRLVNIYRRRAICLLFGNIIFFFYLKNFCHIFHIDNSLDTAKSKLTQDLYSLELLEFFCYCCCRRRLLDNTLNWSDTHTQSNCEQTVGRLVDRYHTSCHKRPKSINNFSNQLTTSIQLKSIEFNWQNKMLKTTNGAADLNKTKWPIKLNMIVLRGFMRDSVQQLKVKWMRVNIKLIV